MNFHFHVHYNHIPVGLGGGKRQYRTAAPLLETAAVRDSCVALSMILFEMAPHYVNLPSNMVVVRWQSSADYEM
jgi:hypothetical protein